LEKGLQIWRPFSFIAVSVTFVYRSLVTVGLLLVVGPKFVPMQATLLFFNLGGGEIMLVFLVVLLFFGSNKIPELARGLGKGIREFKNAANGVQREIEDGMKDVPKKEDLLK
jgi:sec-independent protein translocase protein TatA